MSYSNTYGQVERIDEPTPDELRAHKEEVRHIEGMSMPCPYDICDGSGLVEDMDSSYGRFVKCPCKKEADDYSNSTTDSYGL